MNEGRVLVACEQSQVVCKAFRQQGIEAFSCDLFPCYGGHPEWHILGDALEAVEGIGSFRLENGQYLHRNVRWELIIAHPPCTYLTHCGAMHLHNGNHTMEDVYKAAVFFMRMLASPCDHVAVENPAPMKSAGLPTYSQIIQPYQFGHPFSKRVCLWLRNLPPLIPQTGYYAEHKQWLKHCAGTSRRRAKTFEGIAEAMASQWGSLLPPC